MKASEIWKDVVGFEGLYKVSDKGNVYSVERKDTLGRKWGGLTLKPAYDKDGYITVSLCKNGIRKSKTIHRLVAQTFIPNPNNYLEINHKDENKTNNHVENLEWCTRKYNNNHGKRTEKAIQKISKKVKAVNVKTGEVLTFNSVREAGRKGYSKGSVSSACRGIHKSNNGELIGDGHLYRGHHWSYEANEHGQIEV